MKTRSRSNNFVAILIAILLFALGFALYFIHEQTQIGKSAQGSENGKTASHLAIDLPHPQSLISNLTMLV